MSDSNDADHAWRKFGLFLLFLFAFYVVGRSLGVTPERLQPQALRAEVAALGAWAPLVSALAYAAGSLLLVPGAAMSIAAGLLFGWQLGMIVVVAGSNLGANLSFALGKLLGRDLAERLTRGRLRRIDEAATEHGFRAVFFLRLIPLVPFEALNYGAGLSAIRWRDYALGSFLGMLPGTFAYVYLGDNPDLRRPAFWIASGLLLLLAVLPVIVRRARASRAGAMR